MTLWATENRGGFPHGVVHVERSRSDGAPGSLLCGREFTGMFRFGETSIDDVPPWERCPDCDHAGSWRND